MIDKTLVHHLVATQFSQWKGLPIWPVMPSGSDNKAFHLGDDKLVRMPSAEEYAAQVEKEQRWLPKFAPQLPLQIPQSIALGEHSDDYSWHWSIYRWLDGAKYLHVG